MNKLIRTLLALFFSFNASACIWDSQSLSHEKERSHDLAQTILGESQIQENMNQLGVTLKELETSRKEGDVNWWNNLAGTYLRLNRPQDAVNLLEPVAAKFPDDYGIHANLGTAYHFLGRYQDAEKEIARDLQINPEAHFGLEKYHLALLQHLIRDQKYQSHHVYVDETTVYFLGNSWTGDFMSNRIFDEEDIKSQAENYSDAAAIEQEYKILLQTNAGSYAVRRMLATMAAKDAPPAYRTNWNLMTNTNFEGGVIYMAQMNPKEPACYAMLGIAAWIKRDYHLAATAFEKAAALRGPQTEILNERAADLRQFIRESENRKLTMHLFFIFAATVLLSIVFWIVRWARVSK